MEQTTTDGQSETYARLEIVDLLEGLEDTFAIFLLDAHASIRHDEVDLVSLLLATHFDMACLRKLDSIIDQMQ